MDFLYQFGMQGIKYCICVVEEVEVKEEEVTANHICGEAVTQYFDTDFGMPFHQVEAMQDYLANLDEESKWRFCQAIFTLCHT